MKKNVLILSGLFFVFLCSVCFAKPVVISKSESESPTNFERLVEGPGFNHSSNKYPKDSRNGSGIESCIPAGTVDTPDVDRYCGGCYLFTKFFVLEEEGVSFYDVYYYRIKMEEGLSEWKYLYTGPIWFFSPEDARTSHLEYYHYFLLEYGSVPPSPAEFMVEQYAQDGTLIDSFITNNDYWPPLIESEEHELVFDPVPLPTPCGETPLPTHTPIITPTPTPVVVGMIYGTVTDEEGSPLPKAKVKLESTDVKKRTKTDANGWYSFEELGLNTNYKVSATAEGYSKGITGVYLGENEPEKETNFILRKK